MNRTNQKLLVLKVDSIDHVPNLNDKAQIGFFDLSEASPVFTPLAKTRTFNWQQGCMLQWLGPDYETRILYNDLIDETFRSVVLDITTGEKQVLDRAAYTVAPNGKQALCIDFERHHWCRRGYSYDGIGLEAKNQKIVPGDGIWLLDFAENTSRKILDIQEVLRYRPLTNMKGATHYVEHLMINPSGKRFCFLHRWKLEDGGIYARFYTADLNGENQTLLNDSGRMSHFFWRDDETILAYGGLENSINRLRKKKQLVKYFIKPLLPLYHRLVKDNTSIAISLRGDSYLLLNDKTKEKKRIALELSKEDGHPSAHPIDKNIFITDTYPDPSEGSKAKLYLYDIAKEKAHHFLTLNSLSEYDESPLRCDLHPRWSYDGNYFSLDTMHDGVRSCYVYQCEREASGEE